jgi:hypothetical protein
MANKYLTTVGLAGAMFVASLSFGQVKQQPIPNFKNPFQQKTANTQQNVLAPTLQNNFVGVNPKPKIETVNGSFSVDFQKENVSKETAKTQFNVWLNLPENHSFQQVSERTDGTLVLHTLHTPISNCIIQRFWPYDRKKDYATF